MVHQALFSSFEQRPLAVRFRCSERYCAGCGELNLVRVISRLLGYPCELSTGESRNLPSTEALMANDSVFLPGRPGAEARPWAGRCSGTACRNTSARTTARRCGRTASGSGRLRWGASRYSLSPAVRGSTVLRIIQRQAAGRVSEWENLLFVEGGSDHHRALVRALKLASGYCWGYRPPAPASWIVAA